eukprot:3599583-Pyramimonas_sp.AAC.1
MGLRDCCRPGRSSRRQRAESVIPPRWQELADEAAAADVDPAAEVMKDAAAEESGSGSDWARRLRLRAISWRRNSARRCRSWPGRRLRQITTC